MFEPTTDNLTKLAESNFQKKEKQTEKESWEPIKLLPSLTPKAPALNIKFLPEPLRDWIGDISERMQVAPEFVAAGAIVTISSVIGRQIGIYPKKFDDWFEVPNLWGGIVARPSQLKSPAIKEIMKPINRLIVKAQQQYETEKKSSESKAELILAKINGLKEQMKQAAKKGEESRLQNLSEQLQKTKDDVDGLKSTEKRYKTNDATVEKLGEILKENPYGILLLRDELSGFLSSLNKLGREGDREFYLESWNGYGTYDVDRIGRGTIHIPSICLSIFGGIQPGKLEAYVKQATNYGIGDDGLLQRFSVLVYPDQTKDWQNIDRLPNQKALDYVSEIVEKLATMNFSRNCQVTIIDGFPMCAVRFSAEAQDRFDKWRNDFEHRLRSGEIDCPALESHLAKYRKLIPVVSLILQLIETVDKKQMLESVHIKAIEGAIEFCHFLETHALKIYAIAMNPSIAAAHALAKKIQKGDVRDNMTLRDIYRHHWSLLKDNEDVDRAVSVLTEHNWVKIETIRREGNGGGAPSEILRINPDLLKEKINIESAKPVSANSDKTGIGTFVTEGIA
jgi:hypothetical protein